MNAHEVAPDYVLRLSRGDRAAERELVERFDPLLRAKVRIRFRRAAAHFVDDVVQETFTRVLAAVRLGKVTEPERFGGFVSRVCDNVLHELYRSGKRAVPMDESTPDRPARDNPEGVAAWRESAATAERLILELPVRDREILELVLVEETDKDEVCRRFQITRDHLRVVLHRAKDRLRKLMGRSDERRAAAKNRP